MLSHIYGAYNLHAIPFFHYHRDEMADKGQAMSSFLFFLILGQKLRLAA
jgi:hypothetical protein